MAPETILNIGHDLAVDYWALGILIFEFLIGYTPFYSEDPLLIYNNILTNKYKIPKVFDEFTVDIIKNFL
jgi:serine/threonine protein kinase